MRIKKCLAIATFALCLALIVAAVTATAAWFGGSASGRLSADLTIGSDSASSSLSLALDSSAAGDVGALTPAMTVRGLVGAIYPGNYGVVGGEYDPESAQKLYAQAGAPSVDPNTILQNASVVTFYLTVDASALPTDSRQTLRLSLDGVYIASELQAGGEARNCREEFNVRMSLVKNVGSLGEPDYVEDEALSPYVRNEYSAQHPYGHDMYFDAAAGVYTVKFEIYFNKVDVECDFDLVDTQLTLCLTLAKSGEATAACEPYPSGENAICVGYDICGENMTRGGQAI